MDHIVYCDKKAKELSRLLSDEQTMVIRGAAGRKLPHGRVAINDTVYLLENDSSGIIRAKGIVSSVFNSDKLSLEESEKIIEENMTQLKLTERIRRSGGLGNATYVLSDSRTYMKLNHFLMCGKRIWMTGLT